MALASTLPQSLQNHAKALIFIGFFGVPAIAKMPFSGYNISYFKPRACDASVKYRKPLNALDKTSVAVSFVASQARAKFVAGGASCGRAE